jgi:L-ascorbate metabolism protein UlaG (beta-lactamase superfamily)
VEKSHRFYHFNHKKQKLMKILKQFGGKVTSELIQRYQQSENWKDGQFQNLETADMSMSLSKVPGIIYKQISNSKGRMPKKPLPIIPFDKVAFEADSDKTKMIWYGHSVILMRMNGKTILIDPMLGKDTTPIAPVANKRFSENTLSLIDDFPEIDLIIFTHDHYDHLDYDSVQKLKSKTKQFFVALGVKRHLVSWGVAADIITEFDWWDHTIYNDISITFTPTQHFSGRGLTDRFKGLWGGWAFKTANENIWFSGDGGYGKHFEEIGKRLGSFDFAFMECGQYNEDWYDIHLFPKESVQAAIDAKAQKVMPVHWAGFALSYQHTWTEPAEEFVAACLDKKINHGTPEIGALFTIDSVSAKKWWLSL